MPTATAAHPRPLALRFAAAGLAWSFGLFAFLRFPWIEAHVVWPITRLQGNVAAALSGVSALPVDVTLACSGTDVLAMCVGAVLAYPARGAMRAAGVAGGVAVVLALNIIRIATLGRVVSSPALFDTLHLYVWPALLALAAAAFVFVWMRAADAAPPAAAFTAPAVSLTRQGRRFIVLTAILIVAFAAASPWYLSSAWVLATASLIARAAAALLRFGGIPAVASGNLLVTARGGFTVTQECIATPLISIYLAAAIAYLPAWRSRTLAVVATVPIFIALGIVRLLVVAMPPALMGSPLFFIHAFYQLLMATVVIVAAGYWRHGTASFAPVARGIAAGGLALALLMPVAARLFALGPAFEDPQGAVALMPAFQVALLFALWIAVFAPALARVSALLIVLLIASQAALFALLHATGGFPMLARHVPELRAWALAVPLACFAAMRVYENN